MEIHLFHTKNGIIIKKNSDPYGMKECEPDGKFELGIESMTTKKLEGKEGLYTIKWPLGFFYLSCDKDYDSMEKLVSDYMKSGRILEEVRAEFRNPPRPKNAFPDDGHWLEEYLKSRGAKCMILLPKIHFESDFEPSLG